MSCTSLRMYQEKANNRSWILPDEKETYGSCRRRRTAAIMSYILHWVVVINEGFFNIDRHVFDPDYCFFSLFISAQHIYTPDFPCYKKKPNAISVIQSIAHSQLGNTLGPRWSRESTNLLGSHFFKPTKSNYTFNQPGNSRFACFMLARSKGRLSSGFFLTDMRIFCELTKSGQSEDLLGKSVCSVWKRNPVFQHISSSDYNPYYS